MGIGADRYRQPARCCCANFGVDVLLLDDGFQHWKLARDVDMVLIDALNPFGGGDVFPLGRLREPLEGLARADIILITRSEFSDLAPAIERLVRRWNPQRAGLPRARGAAGVGGASHRAQHRHRGERPFERAGRVLRPGQSAIVPPHARSAWAWSRWTGSSSTTTTATARTNCGASRACHAARAARRRW